MAKLPVVALAWLVALVEADHAHDVCRIHTGNVTWQWYRWRNAYTAASGGGTFDTHEYGYCNAGRGPWAWGASNVTVEECKAQCAALHCTCFDFMCANHEAANCTCPSAPAVTPIPTAKRIACVGDSITAGYLSTCGRNYPNQLQVELGSSYNVSNFGVGGQTMLKPEHLPPGDHSSYWDRPELQLALTSGADFVVLMLGTNDAKADRWAQFGGRYFPSDYADMVRTFEAMPSKPKVLLMVPPPLYKDGAYQMNQTVLNSLLPGRGPAGVGTIAESLGLAAPIDVFGLFQGHCPVVAGTPGHSSSKEDVPCDWIGSGGADACHPDDVGYGEIAALVASAIRTSVVQ